MRLITSDDLIRAGACPGGVRNALLSLNWRRTAVSVEEALDLARQVERRNGDPSDAYVRRAAGLAGAGGGDGDGLCGDGLCDDGYGQTTADNAGDGRGCGYGYGRIRGDGYGPGDGYDDGYGYNYGDGYGHGHGRGHGNGGSYGHSGSYGHGNGGSYGLGMYPSEAAPCA